jgi:6-phosphogluconolactonase
MANDALLRHVPIPPGQIFRMRGELPPAEAAADYQKRLQNFFGPLAGLPAFDLVLLGMGPDGHTASLFPGTPALGVKDRWVTENPVNTMSAMRLTLTLPALNNARDVWFIATGAEKAEVFARVRFTPDPNYPASLIHPSQGGIRWYVDDAILQTT